MMIKSNRRRGASHQGLFCGNAPDSNGEVKKSFWNGPKDWPHNSWRGSSLVAQKRRGGAPSKEKRSEERRIEARITGQTGPFGAT